MLQFRPGDVQLDGVGRNVRRGESGQRILERELQISAIASEVLDRNTVGTDRQVTFEVEVEPAELLEHLGGSGEGTDTRPARA